MIIPGFRSSKEVSAQIDRINKVFHPVEAYRTEYWALDKKGNQLLHYTCLLPPDMDIAVGQIFPIKEFHEISGAFFDRITGARHPGAVQEKKEAKEQPEEQPQIPEKRDLWSHFTIKNCPYEILYNIDDKHDYIVYDCNGFYRPPYTYKAKDITDKIPPTAHMLILYMIDHIQEFEKNEDFSVFHHRKEKLERENGGLTEDKEPEEPDR